MLRIVTAVLAAIMTVCCLGMLSCVIASGAMIAQGREGLGPILFVPVGAVATALTAIIAGWWWKIVYNNGI